MYSKTHISMQKPFFDQIMQNICIFSKTKQIAFIFICVCISKNQKTEKPEIIEIPSHLEVVILGSGKNRGVKPLITSFFFAPSAR